MIMPEWLIHQYHQEERIDETDQDQQYCCVTDQEARDEYYSSTPDVLTKPLAEDKLYTSRKQMYGHEPEQAEAKDDGPAPENMDAGTNQQRTERIQRLVQLYSELDLAHLPTTKRAAREQEMASAYQTFDEEGLDTALATAESMAPAKVKSGGERTPPTPSEPTERGEEKIALQIRRRLSMREAARLSDSHAVMQLLDMKARVMRATKQNLAYLEWLPDDCPLPTIEPLGELLAWLTQLMGEVEHLHGVLGQEPAPWLLLCRDSDLLNADGSTGQPINYDNAYVDLMRAYRDAARTAMSVADAAGMASPHPHAGSKSWRIALQLESALWIYRGQNPDPRPLVETMAREFERLTMRFDDVIHLHSKEKAAECRMANMLVEDVLSHGAYELPESARRHVVAYSDIATLTRTTEPPGARHARWYLRREVERGGNAAFHIRGMQRYLTSRAPSPARPPSDGSVAQPVSEVWWIKRTGTPTTPRCP
jgi:hypothetical protein